LPAIVGKLDKVLFGRNIERDEGQHPEVRTVIGDAPNWPLSRIDRILSFISVFDSRRRSRRNTPAGAE
jgi:hypothetical protein